MAVYGVRPAPVAWAKP